MKCVVCRNGEIRPGRATVTMERDRLVLVVRHVPADVCDNCGEEYLDESTTQRVLDLVEEASEAGVQVDVREYAAA